ncbi:MAG: cell division protein FtsL [Phascolarctobacterium sp.]|mgnify:CR=1 FL=1|nr:cell division protein FtsL [Phascolarctobacterium sp.]
MLAENYRENYNYKTPWELQREEAIREEQARLLQRKREKELAKQERNAVIRKYVSVTMFLVMSTYGGIVLRSEAYASAGHQLVTMKQEEKALRSANDELKIEVEELKGPTRIIRLAEQKLGMSVARSNIYVKGL